MKCLFHLFLTFVVLASGGLTANAQTTADVSVYGSTPV